MNYLHDNANCSVNDEQARLAVLVEHGHIIFFHRSRKSKIIDNIIQVGGSLAGATLGMAVLPVVLAGMAVNTAMDKINKPKMLEILNKIKVKFKLSDDEIFISNPEKCSVVLSGKFFPLNSTCKVDIDGVFNAGNTTKQFRIKMQFGERPGVIAKTFSKGDFPVSFAK